MTQHDRPPLDVDGVSPGLAIFLQWLASRIETMVARLDHAITENSRDHARIIAENTQAHNELRVEVQSLASWQHTHDDNEHDEQVKRGVWHTQGKGLLAGVGIATAVIGLARALGVV